MPTPTVVRRRRVIKLGMGLLVLGLLGSGAARIYLSRTESDASGRRSGMSEPETEVARLVNAERVKSGRGVLRVSARLAVAARAHSFDMAIRTYLAHKTPEGSGPTERLNGLRIDYDVVGENIYADSDYLTPGVAERAVRAWLDSPTHRAIMLSERFTETGVGVAHSADGRTYITQDFIH
ncbi:MAG: CAP domain-containing protein [Candidatus Binataceae bacterium]